MTRAWPYIPGVPAAGHVTGGGFWHPGPIDGCVRCDNGRQKERTMSNRNRPNRSVKVTDVAGTDEPVIVDRGDVASTLRASWFWDAPELWDAPENTRDQVFGWLDQLQQALDRNEHTADLEAALGIRIEEQ